MADPLAPVTLEGDHVRLEPLSSDHAATLWDAARGTDVFRWFPAPVEDEAAMRGFVEEAIRQHAAGEGLGFATRSLRDGRLVGSTRFCARVAAHRRVEIGYTWIAPDWQRSAVNTEAKRLLLDHAFDVLTMNRVEFKTDSLNARSRAALARLGASEEGIFRNHMVTASGRIRHSVYFSIIREDWPEIRARLADRLARG